MSVYNILAAEFPCPHCGASSLLEIDLHFGRRDLARFELGQHYQWMRKGGFSKGGRPAGGSCDGEGYSVCPACDLDFFVIVRVENDRLVSVRANPDKPGYIKGGEYPGTFPGSTSTS